AQGKRRRDHLARLAPHETLGFDQAPEPRIGQIRAISVAARVEHYLAAHESPSSWRKKWNRARAACGSPPCGRPGCSRGTQAKISIWAKRLASLTKRFRKSAAITEPA